MEYTNLCDMINCLQYGTKLHIGVLFFGNNGNVKCVLPNDKKIHPSPICEEFKGRGKEGFDRCFRCRNLAIRKAQKRKKAFGGICVNGVYEYTRPVVIGDETVCVIYIGNILDSEKGYEKLVNSIKGKEELFDTMEKNFNLEKCETVGKLIESYIRFLLERFSNKKYVENPLIENIKSYISANSEFNIEISHIAKIFHYNEKYLGRLFKKTTSQSINDYINDERLLKAKHLILNTDEKLIDISLNVGFKNVTYFNRLFKKKFGITPTQFRKGAD